MPSALLSAVVVPRPVALGHAAAVQRPHEFRLLVLVLALYLVGQVFALYLNGTEVKPPHLLRVAAVYRVCMADCAVTLLRSLLADAPLMAAVTPLLVVALVAGQATVVLLAQELAKAQEIVVARDWLH